MAAAARGATHTARHRPYLFRTAGCQQRDQAGRIDESKCDVPAADIRAGLYGRGDGGRQLLLEV